ncbi:unnamed protein product [Caretta caretta]
MDYQVVAKAISLRLGSVLADVVHPDQTYTVSGRRIFDNLYLVWDLLELGCRDGLSFALLSLDQEKAFNRVDHGVSGHAQLDPDRTSQLQARSTAVCPLLGQLYTLAIEPFLCLLRRRLTGLVLRELELRLVLSAYADDVLLVVQDPGDLARVEACQAINSAASSPWVNWVKSSDLVVGDGWQASSLPPALQAIRWKRGSTALSQRLPFCHASLSAGELAKFRMRGDRVAPEMDRTTPVPLPSRESAGA